MYLVKSLECILGVLPKAHSEHVVQTGMLRIVTSQKAPLPGREILEWLGYGRGTGHQEASEFFPKQSANRSFANRRGLGFLTSHASWLEYVN